jgi:putative transposase
VERAYRVARLPRFPIAEQPLHVIQRGNNRTPIFTRDADYRFFRACLVSALSRFACSVHAYVLMSNHVHLLMTAREADGIGRFMQSVGGRYARFFNDQRGRTGTLWEGRYRATVIDTNGYLFTCSRYIELNPVRAGMVAHPLQYQWSSHAANALGRDDPLVSPHPEYLNLGRTPKERELAYRALFRSELEHSTLRAIRDATNHAWALGDHQFIRAMSATGRRATPRPRGATAGPRPNAGPEVPSA